MIPFAQINILLAALVGFGLYGLVGAALAVLGWLLAGLALKAAGTASLQQAALGLARFGLTLARRVIGLLAFPFLLALGLVAGFASLGRQHVDGYLPTLPAVSRLADRRAALRRFFRSWLEPRSIALTLANLLVLIAIGCITIGMEVALFVALGAVPVILLVLMMLAVDSSSEPEDDMA